MDFDTLFNSLDDTTLRELEQQFRLSDQTLTSVSLDAANHPSPSPGQLPANDDFERQVQLSREGENY
jgi:hypothetical protein